MKKNSIKNSGDKKDSSFLFSTSLIFDVNIDKLWLYLRDLSSETKNIEFLDNFKQIEGRNTWTPGNIFSLYWVGVTNIKIECISSSVTRMKKKIKWKFICDIGINYYKTMILYRITYDKKTLVKLIFTKCEENKLIDFNPQLQYYLNLQHTILTYLSNLLQSVKEGKKIYQSFIIDKNYKIIWDYFLDIKNLSKISPEIIKNIEYKGPLNKKGTFIKFYQCNMKKTIFLKIVEYLKYIKRKYYKCKFEIIGTELVQLPHSAEVYVKYIDLNKTYFGVLYNLSSNSNDETINKYQLNLKKLINKQIEYINNNSQIFKGI